jgi:FtsP/CotA-like multicopper oxidase with cupredoxin domain
MTSWKDKVALTAQRNRQEIVKAKLNRREMMRLGLLTAGGSLILKQGLSSRAFGALTDPDIRKVPPSPPVRPWVQPMPLLTVKTPVDSHEMDGGPPSGTTPIDGATKLVNHQYCSYDPNTGAYGGKFPPTKFYELVMQEAPHKFHPDYAATTVWGFDGQVPGPNIQARYGEPILVRFHNHLPSVKVPQNFGIAEISTHLHNAHTPSESDGNPVNYINSINDPNEINPLGFKDQHYPNVYAGFTARGDKVGDPREALSSLWFHDHHLDFTAQNVYKGMFGCYNLFDDKDTGDETTGLRLPSGKYDIPIFFNDFVFDRDCQAVFDLFNLDGVLGDRFCANGAIQPFLNVDKRRYRFRLYNPGPSRWYEFALWDGTNFLPFWQISSDGNLLPQAVKTTSVRLSVAERADIIVDFGKITPKRLYLVNRLEQVNGRGPTGRILNPGTPVVQINLGEVEEDDSVDPAAAPLMMRELPDPDFGALLARAAKARTRTWKFDRGNGAWTVNGKLFDENVVNAAIDQESEEVWVIQNTGGDWRHPVHIHFEEHRALSRNGALVKPATPLNGCIDYARKDVIPLNTNEEVRIFMRFRDMKGRYVMHCHNVVHEDHAMMVRFDII